MAKRKCAGLGCVLAVAASAVTGSARAENEIFTYTGLCEASGAAALDASHFAVASDETNIIQIYERGNAEPLGDGVDFEDFTNADKSDLEAAAAMGNRIYWISSHSFNSSGQDRPKRKRLFATEIVPGADGPSLKGVGNSVDALRDPLATASGLEKSQMNIEGLAATPNGELMIGFRNLRSDGNALVIALKNPGDVVGAQAKPPEFGSPIPLDLNGKGIRSLELVGGEEPYYLIVAGPSSDDDGFALYKWSGPEANSPPELLSASLQGIRPEGMLVLSESKIQILSDDGAGDCSDEDTPKEQRHFRSIDVKPQ